MNKTFFSFILAIVTCVVVKAQNPYLPLWEFIPDGEPYVFDDPDCPGQKRVYIYGSHDMLKTAYCGLDLVLWSASVNDLKKWRYDGVIFESKKDALGRDLHSDGKGDVLYAPDIVEKTDSTGHKVYYLYPNNQANGRKGMVCKSNRPDGPFTVCNWSKDDPTKTADLFGFDPAAFIDDDGRAYGYWGFKTSNGAELDANTMCSIKEGTDVVTNMIPGRRTDHTFRFFEASSIRKIKDKYVYIYSRQTNDGENQLPSSNYNLAYCYSNNPLGPWTYGGTIIDARGIEHRPDGTSVITATPNGNTHGSICEINGRWYVFYHRQTGTSSFSRQAMVAPINVEVIEGKDGYVKISEAEFTSEGFATEGLDPYTRYAAGIACYYTGTRPSYEKYPDHKYFGSHTKPMYQQYDGTKDPFDPSINVCPMVDNMNGSTVGYKYFNFSNTYGKKGLKLLLNYTPDGTAGEMHIYLDRPSTSEGGVEIGSFKIAAKGSKPTEAAIKVENLKHYNGKHALFFVLTSATEGKSICQLNNFCFTANK